MGETLWTPFRTQLLQDLHQAGFSCARIAARIGGSISTAQVVEKAMALKLAIKEKLAEDVSDPKFRTPKTPHVNHITLPRRA